LYHRVPFDSDSGALPNATSHRITIRTPTVVWSLTLPLSSFLRVSGYTPGSELFQDGVIQKLTASVGSIVVSGESSHNRTSWPASWSAQTVEHFSGDVRATSTGFIP
jgi:hypothetical protein